MNDMSYKDKAALFMGRFKGRPDVYGKQHISKEGKRAFYPVCANFWADGCHIKLKDHITCADCKIKKHDAVSESSVLKHIKGDEQQITYVLQEDFHIWFGALDFDCKPGKESEGYYFKDVALTSEVLTKFKIKHYIARSTGAGFHIYMFFDSPCPSNTFRTIMFRVFELTGFIAQNQQGIRFLPEVFPKQCSGGKDGIGNAIKAPMIETSFKNGKNCFVDSKNEMIPADEQWDYLSKTEKNPPSLINEIMKAEELEPLEEMGAVGRYGASPDGTRVSAGKWQRPMSGSMEKMVNCCVAFTDLKNKMEGGHVPSHNEGFALFHAAMGTVDGLEWFNDKARGWGETDEQRRQLEHSLEKNYRPWTCRKMQDNGVCPSGTKCFNKRPPIEQVEGQTVVRRDLPESKWIEPSPMRYAHSAGNDDYLLKLQEEAKELEFEKDIAIRGTKLKAIINRAQVFDTAQQASLKKYLTEALKVSTKASTNKMFKEAASTKSAEVKKKSAERSDIAVHDDVRYQLLGEGGYAVIKDSKGQTIVSKISGFEILITEERKYIDESTIIKLVYIGVVGAPDYTQDFEIETDTWAENGEFIKFFTKLCGTRFNVSRQNLENIRQASICFSRAAGVERTNYFITQGWYGDTYLMPSVQVDSDGVKPNDQKKIDLSGAGKELASALDFKILEDIELKETLFHIKSELFNTFPRRALFTALAHTLQAGIQAKIGVKQKAPMWIEGPPGTGKSSMIEVLQQFWGKFDHYLNWTTNLKSILDYAHQFKDCCLIVDDYKAIQDQPVKAKAVLQYSYDPTTRGALRRDGTQRGDKTSRSLLLCSGEYTPTSESSVISRIILVHYPHANKYTTTKLYNSCKRHMDNYRGVTPRFLHYFLTQDIKKVRKRLESIIDEFSKPVQEAQNGTRISSNYALNFLTWELLIGFMLHSNAIDHTEADSLISEHKAHCLDLIENTISRCEEESIGIVFAEILRDNLESGSASIRNLEDYNSSHGVEVGVVKSNDEDPDTVYLHPTVVVDFILSAGKSQGLVGTPIAFGEGLKALGFLTKFGKESVYCQARVDGKPPKRYFAVSLTKLGLSVEKFKVVGGTVPMDIPPPSSPPMTDEGLI